MGKLWKEARNVAMRGFSCHDLTFGGRISALVFTTAVWKSRVPLLLVTEAVTTGTNFIVSLLTNTRSTAPFSAHKLHRRRKTADRVIVARGRLSAGAAREKWPETSPSLCISGINDRECGNCVFNPQALAEFIARVSKIRFCSRGHLRNVT